MIDAARKLLSLIRHKLWHDLENRDMILLASSSTVYKSKNCDIIQTNCDKILDNISWDPLKGKYLIKQQLLLFTFLV